MNINIINKVIQGISEQLPLVNSFYTQSPYDSWNEKEVQYGSVAFVVTNVNTNSNTTTYDAVLYYADRLTEDRSNRDSVHSDAATVIQTIVGALNQTDSDYFEIEYPVSITLFEQDFSDCLAGGYANLSIEVEGMGECFEDDFSVPEIIATSAYYTKEEISELFPLRSNLSLVAFSGRFDDLLDKPDIVLQSQYEDLYQGIKDTTGLLAEQVASKLDAMYFGEFKNATETALANTVSQRQFDELYKGVLESTGMLASEMNNKLDVIYFSVFKEQLYQLLANKVDNTSLENVKTAIAAISSEIATKVSSNFFDATIASINARLDNSVTKQQYDDLYNGVYYTTAQLAELLAGKLDSVIFASFREEVTKYLADKLNAVVFDSFKTTIEGQLADISTTKLDNVIFDSFKTIIEGQLAEKATTQNLNSISNDIATINNKLTEKVDKKAFEQYVDSNDNKILYLKTTLQDKVDDGYFKEWQTSVEKELEARVTVQGFANYAANVYTKSEIEERLANYEYYVEQYFNSDEFRNYVDDFVVKIVTDYTEQYLETVLDYYTKQEIDDMLSNLSLESYYSKEEIDEIIENLNLINYYNKTEIDTKLTSFYSKGDIDTKFNNVYTKTNINTLLKGYYTKSEVDALIGDIDSILNNVLYEY